MNQTSSLPDQWNACEFFLAHAASGVNLKAFDLIQEALGSNASYDTFAFERLTRPVLARHAKRIKDIVHSLVKEEALGRLEGSAKSRARDLKTDLAQTISRQMEAIIIRDFTRKLDGPALLTLTAAYHACYKNRAVTGEAVPLFFWDMFFPLLVKSQGGTDKIRDWQAALRHRFSCFWASPAPPADRLISFFEHPTSRKVVSLSFAGILGLFRNDADKAQYLFTVVHQWPEPGLARFHILMSNGLNTALKKEKRLVPREEDIQTPPAKIGIVPADQITEIIGRTVDQYFDNALDGCVRHEMTLAEGHPPDKRGNPFDRRFLAMNRALWQELLVLADIRRRTAYRTRHLLRIIIHYLFEIKGIERPIWQKYIPSVDRVIRINYEQDPRKLKALNALISKRLTGYKKTQKYRGTDWEGFYEDPQARRTAVDVIREISDHARSRKDPNIPAVWFSNQADKGVDDQVLFKFFRQGAKLNAVSHPDKEG